MSQPINVGFVGLSSTGWAGMTLGPSLLQPSLKTRYRLVAVSTASEKSAITSAQKHTAQLGYPVSAYHGDTSLIASDPNIDLVAVSLKPWRQRDAIMAVIEKKKNFFLEWPVGRSLQETCEIAEASRKYGVRSMVGLQGRQSPVVKKVKQLVSSGVIGTVRSTTWIGLIPREPHYFPPLVESDNAYTLDKSKGVTTLRLVAAPQLDSFIYALGSFKTLNATATLIYPIATIIDTEGKPTGETLPAITPDHYTISGLLASGAHATIIWRSAHSSTPGRRHLLWEIDGETGTIRVEAETSSYINIRNPALYVNGEKIATEGTDENVMDMLVFAWEAYAAGESSEYATIDDAVVVHRVVDAVERSLSEGKTVTV